MVVCGGKYLSGTVKCICMSTTYTEAKDFLRNKLGNDHNSARARHKTKTNRGGDHNYDVRYDYGHGEDKLSLSMTYESDTLYIQLSGHDGRDPVFCTFTANNHSVEDIVSMVSKELDISLTER